MRLPEYTTRLFKPQHKRRSCTVVFIDKEGVPRCRGNDDLKGSQEYPIGFGRAIQQLIDDHTEDIDAAYQKLRAKFKKVVVPDIFTACKPDDRWPDARLKEVIASLTS